MSSERVAVYVPALMYRALYPHAQRRRMDVGELMAELAVGQLYSRALRPADESKTPPQAATTSPRARMTTDRLAQLQLMLTADVLTYREMAQQLGVSVGTVSAYAGRIRRGEL